MLKSADQSLQQGNYDEVRQKCAEVLRLLEKTTNRQQEGVAENLIGAAELNQGNYVAAKQHFERAIALAREVLDRRAEVRRLNNLGNVYFYQGQYLNAHDTYQAGLQRLAGTEKENWYPGTRQLSLTNLAVLYQQLGQHQKALEMYQEIRTLPLRMEPNVEAQMLTNLAIVYRRLGDPQKALDTYRKARQILASGPDAAAALFILHNVGVVQALDFQDLASALRTFDEAVAIATKGGNKREVALERLFRGETLLMMQRVKEARVDFSAALENARSLHLVDELWTALYGLGRVQVAMGEKTEALKSFMEAVDVIEAARTKLGKTTLKAEFLAEKRDVYDALIGELLDEPERSTGEILRRMEEGRSRNLKEQLAVAKTVVSLEALQKELDAETGMLVYWVASSRLAVVWITREKSGILQRRITSEEQKQFTRLTQALAQKNSQAWSALADEVSPLLLDPQLPLGGHKLRSLVIVPDGVLHALPFEVLRGSDGKRLVENFAISYLPSAQMLRGKPKQRRQRWPWEMSIVAFADPLPASGGSSTALNGTWTRLPFSAAEAREVAAKLPGKSRLLIGADNLKSALVDRSTLQVPVLHFATHGLVDTNDSRRSRLVFSPVQGDAASQYLFASEIAKLRFDGVELVTLAACESELGRYVRGEGVENFSRVFLGAGAGSTLSTLWRVSDRASAELMGTFYEGLARGETKAEALRKAKVAMQSLGGQHAHPYYWAPYLLSGEGLSPLSPSFRWWQLAVVPLVLGLLFFLRKIFR